MKIIAQPGLSSRETNPYNYLLYTYMEKHGASVTDSLSLRSLFSSAVIHVHWPESFLNHESLHGALLRCCKLVAVICSAKIFGLKIVWTVHNFRAHENRHPKLSNFFYSYFPKICDGFVFLSDYTKNECRLKIPAVDVSKSEVIYHGDYRPIYPVVPTKKDSRAFLKIGECEKVILFFGMIRRYKNVPKLIREFSQIQGAGIRLVIAGRVVNDRTLGDEIRVLAENDSRVDLRLEHVPESELLHYLRAADLIVLPYSEVANSGSVMLALSVGRKVLAPRKGSLEEVQGVVGKKWLSLYDGDLDTVMINSALEEALPADSTDQPNLSQYDWDVLAKKTLSYFESI